MAGVSTRDRAAETVARIHHREPDSRDVARALFAEHLDLDAIRRALGQRAAPTSEPTGGRADDAPTLRPAVDATPAPLGRDLPGDAPLAAPIRPPAPRSRRAPIWVPALLGVLLVMASMLGAPMPGWQDRAQLPAPSSETVPPAAAPAPPTVPSPGAAPDPDVVVPASPPIQPAVAVGRPTDPGLPPSPPRMPARSPEATVWPAEARAEPVAPRIETTSLDHDLPILARGGVDESPAVAAGIVFTPPARPDPVPLATAPPVEVAPPATRVVIHYQRDAGAGPRTPLTDALRRAGFARVDWRAVADGVGRTQTRYFHAADKRLSDRAVAALAAQGRPANGRDFTHFYPPARRGTIEIWLGTGP